MPEIAEVASAVHHIQKHLVGRTLAVVKAQDDANVFGKVGTSGTEFQKALTGKQVVGAGQQGKYFWMIMSSPPHPVFHFGMTGWLHIRGQSTYYYRKNADEEEVWPPQYWKFTVRTAESPIVEAAFTDSRRFSRIRLVDCVAEAIRQTTPLKENGPDPVIDKDILTADWLEQKMNKKHVPIKALLLDQANISGIGNWVGDEILYHARLHPEQYSDTFSSEEVKQLHASILHICQTAVHLLADSAKFPEDWLFKHRWGKGKKDAPTTLPSGEAISFLTVGGRTSCVVPSLQKKTGAVAGDVKKEDLDEQDEIKNEQSVASRKRKTALNIEETRDTDGGPTNTKKSKSTPKLPARVQKGPTFDAEDNKSTHRMEARANQKPSKSSKAKPENMQNVQPKRRSQRQSKANDASNR